MSGDFCSRCGVRYDPSLTPGSYPSDELGRLDSDLIREEGDPGFRNSDGNCANCHADLILIEEHKMRRMRAARVEDYRRLDWMDRDTRIRVDQAIKYPYDSESCHIGLKGMVHPWSHGEPWTLLAARAVLADLLDRRGIKHELERVSLMVRGEIVSSLAGIIEEVHRQSFRHMILSFSGIDLEKSEKGGSDEQRD